MEEKRKFLGLRFHCCGTYTRAYKNRRGDAYVGHCPRCGRSVKIGIDPKKGSNARFFDVY